MLLIAVLLTVLLSKDPVNWAYTQRYGIIEMNPIVDNGKRYPNTFGYSHWSPPYIGINTALVASWPLPGGESDQQIWAACVLAHEAAHLNFRVYEEDIPLAMQYVCLDRLDAPWYLKGIVYWQMQQAVDLRFYDSSHIPE